MSETGPFRCIDGKGGWLEVRRVTFISGGLPVMATGTQGYAVDPSEIALITKAIYEAARVPVPEMTGTGKWRPYESSMLAVSRNGKQVHLELDRVNGGGVSFPPEKAREMAGVLLALADEADAEPSLEEIGELESVLREATGRREPDDMMTGLARAVLLAGWKRGAAS